MKNYQGAVRIAHSFLADTTWASTQLYQILCPCSHWKPTKQISCFYIQKKGMLRGSIFSFQKMSKRNKSNIIESLLRVFKYHPWNTMSIQVHKVYCLDLEQSKWKGKELVTWASQLYSVNLSFQSRNNTLISVCIKVNKADGAIITVIFCSVTLS